MNPPSISDAIPALPIDADVLKRALIDARSQYPDQFIGTELTWLEEHSILAFLAITGFFSREMQGKRTELAEPGRQGGLLGSLVVRMHSEEGLADVEQVKANHRIHFANTELVYDHEIGPAGLAVLFGADATAALGGVRHPVARTMCAVMLWASFDGNQRSQLEAASFIQTVNTMRIPRPRGRRRGAGGSR